PSRALFATLRWSHAQRSVGAARLASGLDGVRVDSATSLWCRRSGDVPMSAPVGWPSASPLVRTSAEGQAESAAGHHRGLTVRHKLLGMALTGVVLTLAVSSAALVGQRATTRAQQEEALIASAQR